MGKMRPKLARHIDPSGLSGVLKTDGTTVSAEEQLALVRGGTGASTAAAARTNLGAAAAVHGHSFGDISGTVPINQGGTGATTAAAARTALGAAAASHGHSATDITSGQLPFARSPSVAMGGFYRSSGDSALTITASSGYVTGTGTFVVMAEAPSMSATTTQITLPANSGCWQIFYSVGGYCSGTARSVELSIADSLSGYAFEIGSSCRWYFNANPADNFAMSGMRIYGMGSSNVSFRIRLDQGGSGTRAFSFVSVHFWAVRIGV